MTLRAQLKQEEARALLLKRMKGLHGTTSGTAAPPIGKDGKKGQSKASSEQSVGGPPPPKDAVHKALPGNGEEDEPEKEPKPKTVAELEKEREEEEKELKRGDMVAANLRLETGRQKDVRIGLKNVKKTVGGKEILLGATWSVGDGEKVALVGRNGCGKTTQLKMLAGEIEPDEGDIVQNKQLKVVMLAQDFVDELNPEMTIAEELLKAVPEAAAFKGKLDDMQKKMDALEKGSPEREELAQTFTDMQDKAMSLGVYELDQRFQDVCTNVGFLKEDVDTIVGELSGGWKMRLGLAKLFMQAPDVLLLDEPTNHLDLKSLEWLENFVIRQTLPIVIVSHDREFMARTATTVVETMNGISFVYKGNYSDFMGQRYARIGKKLKAYKEQYFKAKELRSFINRNKNKSAMASAREFKAQELKKMMESPKWIAKIPYPPRRVKFGFADRSGNVPKVLFNKLRMSKIRRRRAPKLLPVPQPRGKTAPVITMSNVTHGYGEGESGILFKDATLSVSNTARLGIVGDNGAGKSTLLRLLLGLEEPSGGGEITCTAEDISYFTQHAADFFDPEATVWDLIEEANQVGLNEKKLHLFGNNFGWTIPFRDTKVKVLSGGEKARLVFARMVLQPAELLVLDEPTNHLDVPMRESLEHACRFYDGAVIIVSHDRWFLSKTCTEIAEIKDQKLKIYPGDYRLYMDSNPDVRRKVENFYDTNAQIQSLIEKDKQRALDKKIKQNAGMSGFMERQRLLEMKRKELLRDSLKNVAAQ